ncbi:MAG TPA: VOC family protein [Trinickia sp.]|jgi:PhnB protein|uniref:VOC family protein n=1 Tax=Trinickia sp. TaxID=2571163 RepID=UPI002C97742F|nr:VOC family protein [Trinickia sp.]HTI17322.1 VOC family protein [Trinickia sp.]
MSTPSVGPIPEGMHSLTPHLVCANASEAIEFYKQAFGATELFRMPTPEGKIGHAQIKIGDSVVMLTDETPKQNMLGPKALKGTPVSLYLYVENADQVFEQAVAAGATAVAPIADMFWGDRWGLVEDPFGHQWHIATHTRDVSPEDMERAMKNMNCPG